MRKLISAAFSGVLLALPFVAMPISPLGANVRTDLGADVERIVTHAVSAMIPAKGAGGVAVAVHIAGRTLFFNYGFADTGEKLPITSDSLFNVASVRKVFEATLVARAVERGELKLDDPVNKYVTELNGAYISKVIPASNQSGQGRRRQEHAMGRRADE
jgi:beta-lactamase class C